MLIIPIIDCTEVNVSLFIGLCASVFQWKPRSTQPYCNAAGPWPWAQRHASGYSTVMWCAVHCWGIGCMTARLDGLFTPQKGHFSHFQPSDSLCLSLPLILFLLFLLGCWCAETFACLTAACAGLLRCREQGSGEQARGSLSSREMFKNKSKHGCWLY